MTRASTQLPGSDDQLKRLIAAAHDDLPKPDNHRLMVIEQQLAEKLDSVGGGTRSSKWIWLIAGTLMAGSATAAWWVNVSWRNETESVLQSDRVPLPAPAAATSNSPDTDHVAVQPPAGQNQNSVKDQRPTTIYRRELR